MVLYRVAMGNGDRAAIKNSKKMPNFKSGLGMMRSTREEVEEEEGEEEEISHRIW